MTQSGRNLCSRLASHSALSDRKRVRLPCLGARLLQILLVALLVLAGLLVGSCSSPLHPTSRAPSLAQVKKDLAGLNFPQFLEASYRLYVLRYPQTVTGLGLSEEFGVRNDRLNDYSLGYERSTTSINQYILDSLRAFRRATLSLDERVAYDVCDWTWSGGIARSALPVSGYVFSPSENSPDAQLIVFFSRDLVVEREEDVADYSACLYQVARQASQLRSRVAEQVKQGFVPPESALQLALLQLDELRAANAAQKSEWLPPRNVGTNHPLFIPLRDALPHVSSLPVRSRAKTTKTVGKYVASDVMPALERLYQAVAEVRPATAGVDLGWSTKAGGASAYAELVREETGTSLSPSEIYRRARAEMKRLRAEIAELAPRLGLATSAPLPQVSVAAAARLESDIALSGLAAGEQEALMARAIQTLFPTCTIARDTSETGSATGLLLFSEVVPWTCGAPDPFAGFLQGFRLYLLGLAGETGDVVECPALALKARLDLYMAAADAVLDTGIHSLGWNQEEAQREFAGMLEAIGSETRVALSHGRASLQTIETNDNIAFSDVARAAGSPGRAAVAFAAWSEIARLRDEASEASSGSWSESSFHDILVGHGALPLVVAEKLVDAAFGS